MRRVCWNEGEGHYTKETWFKDLKKAPLGEEGRTWSLVEPEEFSVSEESTRERGGLGGKGKLPRKPLLRRLLSNVLWTECNFSFSPMISSIVMFFPVMTVVCQFETRRGSRAPFVLQIVRGIASVRAMVRVRVTMMTVMCLRIVLRRSFL